ncbi:hypothetical protein BD324DRAFT_634032 [Kockovaella imperatae]|uniref:CENP-V/GFA domain-containing protein n=1 Tax=Kockovaella imperatae TaxID=4999 RepID=A0A1Y1UAR0_9TREE|nr:hypothetical protein BD324DRAFT_634032 [Kockovaella imperatae]ORX35141.1 hypothetical protein BD324DRAFT_634032 [Kockovaella imperatae]
MSDDHTFHLSCHCQSNILRITYPADTEPFNKNQVCDCSYCLKKRIVWSIAPAGSVKVLRGFDKLRDYQFGGKNMHHRWCGECGSNLVATYKDANLNFDMPMYFNMRNIRDDHFDLWKYPVTPINFSQAGDKYNHPELSDIPGAQEYLEKRAQGRDGPTEILLGSCHCKAIKFALIDSPLGTTRMNDCACSICLGNGSLWIYPPRQDFFFSPSAPDEPYHPHPDSTFDYGYYKKENLMYHCRECGCNLFELEPPEGLAKYPLEKQRLGVNASLLTNISDYFEDVSGLSWDDEKRKEGYESKTKTLESMRRGRTMKLAGPPHYKLDLSEFA